MKKFILEFALLTLILYILLYALSALVDQGLRKNADPIFKEWNEMADGAIKAELLINGSSRARAHVSPSILDSILGIETYNIGIVGHHFDTEYCRFKFYRQYNPTPRYIIQCLDFNSLTRNKEVFQRMQFAPYVRDTIVQNCAKNIGAFSWIDFVVPFAKYRFENETIFRGIREYFGMSTYVNDSYKGFEAERGEWNDDFDKMLRTHPDGLQAVINQETLKSFRTFLSECERDGIVAVLVYTPEYAELRAYVKDWEKMRELYVGIAEEFNVPLLDYTEHAISFERKNFVNSTHLNQHGAEQFSRILARDLKPLLKK